VRFFSAELTRFVSELLKAPTPFVEESSGALEARLAMYRVLRVNLVAFDNYLEEYNAMFLLGASCVDAHEESYRLLSHEIETLELLISYSK